MSSDWLGLLNNNAIKKLEVKQQALNSDYRVFLSSNKLEVLTEARILVSLRALELLKRNSYY